MPTSSPTRRAGRLSSWTPARRWSRCSRSAAAGASSRATCCARTRDHDHVAHEDELGIEVVTGPLEAGGLHVEALPTPGHSEDHLAFVVNGELCFSGDILFKDAVGGGRRAGDPPLGDGRADEASARDARVFPGHTDETTIGREWEENPFVRVWRGLDPEGDEPCRVGGEEATVVVWSPDYDGKGKALVRFADGREAIVGGSRVERG